MKIKFKILSFAFCCIFFGLKSQQEAIFNHSANNLFLISPAGAGSNEQTQLNLLYKKNWLGIVGSPEMRGIAVDGALEKNCGWGLQLFDNSNGLFRSTNFLMTFRYRLQLSKNQHLSFAISGGLLRQYADFSQIKALSPDEFYTWPQNQTNTQPDASAGLMYKLKKTELLFAANHLLQNKFVFSDPTFNQNVSYQQLSSFTLMFRQTILWHQNKWAFVPVLIVRSTMGLPALIELNTLFSYEEKVHFGAIARTSKSIVVTIGYGKTSAMRVLYSFEYDQNIYNTGKGGHEISLLIGLKTNSKTK